MRTVRRELRAARTGTLAPWQADALAASGARAPDFDPGADARVRRAEELIAADPGAPHTVRSLAASVSLSPSRFAHLFTQRTGRAPMRALREARLRHAARLLVSRAPSTSAGSSGPASESRRAHIGRANAHNAPPKAFIDRKSKTLQVVGNVR